MKALKFFTTFLAVLCLATFSLKAQSDSKVIVNAPANIAGDYASILAAYGPLITEISGPLVEAEPVLACDPITNDLTGAIALIDRGTCYFSTKANKAEAAGAIAVIVCNNDVDHPYAAFSMGGPGTATLPAVMLPYAYCQTIRAELANGVMVTLSPDGIPAGPGEVCEKAVEISAGIHTVAPIVSGYGQWFPVTANGTHAAWYSYTPSADMPVTVRSCGLTTVDTRLAIFTGEDCDHLALLTTQDDCDLNNNFASQVGFMATAGTRYFIYWDDLWDYHGFDFEIVEGSLPGTIVNFSVDMSLTEIGFGGVFLSGSFTYWNNVFPMTDADGDGIYTLSLTLKPGTYQFKFKNATDGWEDIVVNHPEPEIPANCVTGANNDRFIEVGNNEMDVHYCFNYCVDCSVVTEGKFASIVKNPFLPGLTQAAWYSMAFPTLVDIDADGDLDMYISHRVYNDPCWEVVAFEFWENEGTAVNPNYVKKPGDIHGLPTSTAVVAFVDIDADGDLDAFTSSHCFNATIQFHENTGSATQPVFGVIPPQTMGTITGIGFAMLAFGDLDGDGDYDALINGFRPAQFYYLKNTGTPTAYAYTVPEVNPFGLSIPLPNSSEWSQFVDWDCDGDLDILNSHWQGGDHDRWLLYLHENTGTPTAPAFSTMELLSNQFILAATWGDMNGDGDKEVFYDRFYFENVSETPCIVGVSNHENERQVSLSPNPASGFLTIKLTGEMLLHNVTIEVFNSIGVLTRQLEYDVWDFSAGVQLDVSDLAPGFYTLKIGSGGNFVSGKFLKKEM